jgi:hypothetical protein
VVTVSGGGDIFQRPAEIRKEEGGCPRNARQVVVVNERDPAWAQQLPEVEQIDEDGIEPVVAVHDGQVEPAALARQAGQRDLRFLGVMVHQAGDAGVVQELQAAPGVAGVLVGVDDDVPGVRFADGEQAFADEQRRDP